MPIDSLNQKWLVLMKRQRSLNIMSQVVAAMVTQSGLVRAMHGGFGFPCPAMGQIRTVLGVLHMSSVAVMEGMSSSNFVPFFKQSLACCIIELDFCPCWLSYV